MSRYFKKIEENMNVDFLAKLDEAREYGNKSMPIAHISNTDNIREKFVLL